jgi:hypothetical protein
MFGAAARCRNLADFYAYGFNHPDEYWRVVSSPARTDALVEMLSDPALTDAPDAVPDCVARLAPLTDVQPT